MREEVTALNLELWRTVQAELPGGTIEAIIEEYQNRGGAFKKPQPVTPESEIETKKANEFLERAEKACIKWAGELPTPALLEFAQVHATLALVAAIKEQGKQDCCLNKGGWGIAGPMDISLKGETPRREAVERLVDDMFRSGQSGG